MNPPAPLLDVAALLSAYADLQPDAGVPAQRVAFGTSGHRGSAFARSFNAWHVRVIVQAICDFRRLHGIDGPLYLGIDTHALSQPAFEDALEVLAGNNVHTCIAAGGGFTPTPAISHAILAHNRGRRSGCADGIVLTPSHNPPESGGLKYNPPHGGPAETAVTGWIEARANGLLAAPAGVRRMPYAQALRGTRTHDFLHSYVEDLGEVIDFDLIRSAGVRMGVDPLGGAGVDYWQPIAERYGLDLQVLSLQVDPQFAFMSRDFDGQIRMDPSSPQVMQGLIARKDEFDIAFACDTDHDRHGIVTPSAGLLPPNHYLAVVVDYLLRARPDWSLSAAIGKAVVSSGLIDRVAHRLRRRVIEVPVGFKWFVDGLLDGRLAVAGEESAGISFQRRSGGVWTTDKDGFAPSLLAAEITARSGCDPGACYRALTGTLGMPHAARISAPATPAQKTQLAALRASQVAAVELAGERVTQVLERAPGNAAPIGGIKVCTANGWFAARPSGTEDLYKIYAESFRDEAHLQALLVQAQSLVDRALASSAALA
ncbi:alpha-D-glucose phosphate-specific phosphoglucomutase [Aquimonas sp.]|jgi:phosphoglucomutase|uniref:alpha-D-glucose phosphate-specific phosphoglucomutase n=1 Tax=Aquimonas sp. TaxID=1872588 RepID=UPI0037C091BC